VGLQAASPAQADTTITTITILWPFYRTNCISQHLQLWTGGLW